MYIVIVFLTVLLSTKGGCHSSDTYFILQLLCIQLKSGVRAALVLQINQ